MKKFIAILFLAAIGSFAFAHPPKEVKLTYDAKSEQLTIAVMHGISKSPVTDPTKHFIKQIELQKNGATVVNANYLYQQYPDGETIIIKMPAKAGDKVTVSAYCSIAGEKETEFIVK